MIAVLLHFLNVNRDLIIHRTSHLTGAMQSRFSQLLIAGLSGAIPCALLEFRRMTHAPTRCVV